MIYWDLFLGFLKVGCFTFGGGYAAIPLIRDVALSYGWLTEEEFLNMIAVSESTPGPIGVNMATYVGFETAGIPGAVTATLGLICPSIIIILIIARVLKQFRENKTVDAAFYGLRPCSVALIAAAAMGVFEFFIQKKGKAALENFSLAASMLVAMAGAVLIGLL